jgi:hypothetical protein
VTDERWTTERILNSTVVVLKYYNGRGKRKTNDRRDLGDGEQSRTSGDGQRTALNAIPGEYRRGCRGPIGSSEERRARVRKSARRTDLYAPRRRGSIKRYRRRRRVSFVNFALFSLFLSLYSRARTPYSCVCVWFSTLAFTRRRIGDYGIWKSLCNHIIYDIMTIKIK